MTGQPGLSEDEVNHWLGILQSGTLDERAQARKNLSRVCRQRGMVSEAIELLELNVRDGVSDADQLHRLAALYRDAGRDEDADEADQNARALIARPPESNVETCSAQKLSGQWAGEKSPCPEAGAASEEQSALPTAADEALLCDFLINVSREHFIEGVQISHGLSELQANEVYEATWQTVRRIAAMKFERHVAKHAIQRYLAVHLGILLAAIIIGVVFVLPLQYFSNVLNSSRVQSALWIAASFEAVILILHIMLTSIHGIKILRMNKFLKNKRLDCISVTVRGEKGKVLASCCAVNRYWSYRDAIVAMYARMRETKSPVNVISQQTTNLYRLVLGRMSFLKKTEVFAGSCTSHLIPINSSIATNR
jgi:hypothetical protein